MPTSVGSERAEGADYSWDGMRRGSMPFAVLQHTVEGEGRLRFEATSHRVSAGDTMLVTVPHAHRYWLEDGESWRFFWIAFSGQEALRILRIILIDSGPLFRLSDAGVRRLAAACLDLSDAEAVTAGQASAIGYALLMALYDEVLGRSKARRSDGSQAAVLKVVAHVRAHLGSGLGVGALADVAGCSRAHFTRLFTAIQGMSPSEFVLAQRMAHAASLLGEPGLAVKEVSHACGYQDPNYFAKAFRAAYGVSPSQFRSTGMYGAAPATSGRIVTPLGRSAGRARTAAGSNGDGSA